MTQYKKCTILGQLSRLFQNGTSCMSETSQKLTHKQKLFCEEYIKDLNATQAAIRAKYSEKTAQRMGSENLSKPLIQDYIAKLQNKRSERTEITQDMVLKELACLAFSNVQEFYEEGGDYLKDITSLDENTARCIRSIKTKKIYNAEESDRENKVFDDVTEIAKEDKTKALDLLMQHLGMKNNELKLNLTATKKMKITIAGSK